MPLPLALTRRSLEVNTLTSSRHSLLIRIISFLIFSPRSLLWYKALCVNSPPHFRISCNLSKLPSLKLGLIWTFVPLSGIFFIKASLSNLSFSGSSTLSAKASLTASSTLQLIQIYVRCTSEVAHLSVKPPRYSLVIVE